MEKQLPGIYLHVGELKKLMRILPDEMARDAVWSFLKYETEGIEPDKTDYIVLLAFENLRELQERNEERYALRCEKAKEASKKRWDKQTDTVGIRIDTGSMPTDKDGIPAMPNENVNENENVNVNVKENESPLRENARARADEAAEQQTLADFERFRPSCFYGRLYSCHTSCGRGVCRPLYRERRSRGHARVSPLSRTSAGAGRS